MAFSAYSLSRRRRGGHHGTGTHTRTGGTSGGTSTRTRTGH